MKNTERPQGHDQHDQEAALRCPRCDSPHTKFCYYNNYSRSQPRHFCKACKRYWTRGGTLRNVPVGGGCRKNKRPTRPSAAATGLAAPIAITLPADSRSTGAHQNSSSSLDRSLEFQVLPSSGSLQDQNHALEFPLAQFGHAVDLHHHLQQLHRPPEKAQISDDGFLFPREEADDYGSLSHLDNNYSIGARQRQYLRADDSSCVQAGAAETTVVNDLFWPPQPECCQILPITDRTSLLYSIDD